ncbi:MAG: hypothetical protein AB1480_11595 [Nitrospirota bacterium]
MGTRRFNPTLLYLYKNGGLFLKHQIEELHGKTIQIADAACEKLFDFFDQYQWHLDERPLRKDNEINPDVLGYIFEKYINQKQMGAYYTKEDITEYISKNTVIPFLFDAARQKCKIAFEGESSVWRLLQLDPDRYIYPAVKKGVDPISLVCTQRMEALQRIIYKNSEGIWLSNYAERPSKLFVGAEVLLTIAITRARKNGKTYLFSTSFIKWGSEERPTLFNRIAYSSVNGKPKSYVFPKLGFMTETAILNKIIKNDSKLICHLRKSSKYPIYYRIGGGRYWKIFTNFQPQFMLNGKKAISSRENYLYLDTARLRDAVISILSSSLFYWYFILTTNCRDLNPSDLHEFPINLDNLSNEAISEMISLCRRLMDDYQKNSEMKEKTSSLTGRIVYQEFYPRLSKPFIDEIDRVLAKHYGFTDEELDFIINYDIKYRMGRESEEAD